MARYHRNRARPFCIPSSQETKLLTNDREDSGVQLDEPCSPVARQHDREEIISMRHGVTITRSPKHRSAEISQKLIKPDISKQHHSVDIGKLHLTDRSSYRTPETNSMVRSSHQCKMAADKNGCKNSADVTVTGVTSVTRGTKSLNLCNEKDIQLNNNLCNDHKSVNVTNQTTTLSPSRIPKVNAALNLDEDEGLDIRDGNSDLNSKEEYSYNNETDSTEASSDMDSDSHPHPRFSLTGESLSSCTTPTKHHLRGSSENKAKTAAVKKEKDSKKRKFRKLLPALRRSQSVGCEQDLSTPDHTLFLETCPGLQDTKTESCTDTSDGFRRLIHKTCSADAAMMANEVLPLDPQELVRNKQKSSIARNMRKKFQKLKRRNTDSLLTAAIMSVRGSHRISQADAMEWGRSFESLLSDKNGIEMFRSFLKSEFSEENIEFWIECEEFKTIRTNKLATRAQKIYSDFIAIKASKQVNLDSKTRLDTVTSLENPTRDMFHQAQKRIQYLMENDSYKRFIETDPAYLHLVGKLPLQYMEKR